MTNIANFRRSRRASALNLSEIAHVSDAAEALRAAGKPVLTFGTGEPDFPTPVHVIEAAHQAALRGDTTYTSTQGTPALRQAVADQAGFETDPAEVLISTGAKQVLSNALLATVDPGDEVIVPAPYWTSYSDIIDFCEATLVSVPCPASSGFLLTPEALEMAITDKTRWLMLNSPGNPSGVMYSADQLRALADVLRRYPHVWILADEIYQHIAYVPFTSFRNAAPDLADRTLIVNGVSKAYAMTGWRIGWGIGPVPLIKAMTAIQGQSTSGACSVAQAASVAALTGPQDHLETRSTEFRARRDLVVQGLNAIDGLICPEPSGAFYVFPSCSGVFGQVTPQGKTIETDADYCSYLLDEALVALVPGRAFGLPGYFRLSYAYSKAELREGLRRIAAATAELK
ncbi:pyridoxal phosphate-dependent aminotransferase [Aliisedimentitalea scapharcae]|uniref:Aminotransferase n=1 Tax=Aliisedimentitalea scapharcae TaxID=1524259 RepID=A0ABZ2XTZ2_9RHOB